MNVKRLREILTAFPDDADVVASETFFDEDDKEYVEKIYSVSNPSYRLDENRIILYIDEV